ncbi:MAG: lactate utilization protein [Flavobacteriaceae bacterium]|uniref:Lactate utilization protein B/C n=1 Tax=Flavobacterium kayseriense TaxID=2764714 RepID=A0ABR7J9M0_9FLAO|nr:lactate utilization protein B/C [Flavobacterium kayseriense]MBC5842219.1 lactate utilization protein B/C [Flavobacterium kayseriense]MBC5848749.1 lactate utilization protein B/C [Flavobacterium kayseriense]MBU0940572.1 lactate utilization protein [Bacteroidota bacterium]MBX9887169.1 lactate utilization protein [Flavobacteriaceae bacterium]
MSLFRKIFGSSISTSEEEKEKDNNGASSETDMSIDEQFIFNFKKNGGKFLYCENLAEVKEQFENILEENDWFESDVLCFDPTLFSILEENKLNYKQVTAPKFLFSSCENLIAEEGSILFSSNQIKQNKPNELPADIIIYATTSQILAMKSDSLSAIKKKYERNYPTNITAIKYFEKAKEEDFTQYGSSAKNLYLLLLEDL